HSEIDIKDLKVPADNLLGGEGNGFNMGQHRLGYGRLRHGMHNIAKAQRALDMAAARVTKRSTFGQPLADRQAVQFMLAECASQLYIGRLMLLNIAYKAEKGLDFRQENSIAKVFLAHMVHHVIDTAIQLHGALGFSQDTPLAAPGRRPRRGAQVEGRPQRHQGVPRARHHRARRRRGFAVALRRHSGARASANPEPRSCVISRSAISRFRIDALWRVVRNDGYWLTFSCSTACEAMSRRQKPSGQRMRSTA